MKNGTTLIEMIEADFEARKLAEVGTGTVKSFYYQIPFIRIWDRVKAEGLSDETHATLKGI